MVTARSLRGFAGLALVWAIASFATPAAAQTPIFQQGDSVVTGFSGTAVSPSAASADPADQTFIDTAGTSAEILNVQPAGPPAGQLVPAQAVLKLKASDVGQVFAITFDDAAVPNIYLGATSAFGLQIVSGAQRAKVGSPAAEWMPGQFGNAMGGEPGSIYKVDGTTGAVSLFATVGTNSGPGLGDVVYDKTTKQFFVSDLDTGLIYRLDATGTTVDSFDHGVTALGAIGLVATPDDGVVANIKDPGFKAEDPGTWGYTPKTRRVGGMAVHNGRLYYAVAEGPQVWSVGVTAEGFAADARLELDGTGLPSTNAITDITFDDAGLIYLAQRGDQRGSYDYSAFAEPQKSSVIRFHPDPNNPAAWVAPPETYAIGANPDYQDADGGIDIGLGTNAAGQGTGQCDMLWSTGDALMAGSQIVDGLQGNDIGLVRPANVPPTQTYLVDYDSQPGDSKLVGHIGDVEVWRNCNGTGAAAGPVGPGGGAYPTGDQGGSNTPPPYYPPTGTGTVTISKTGDGECYTPPGAPVGSYACLYTITVTNNDPANPYPGPIEVTDQSLPTADIQPNTLPGDPPWQCAPAIGGKATCTLTPPPGVPAIGPGGNVKLHIAVVLPSVDPKQSCDVPNIGGIMVDGTAQTWSATDPLPAGVMCTKNPTTLDITKTPGQCVLNPPPPPGAPSGGAPGDITVCTYTVTVTNTGKTPYVDPIVVTDNTSFKYGQLDLLDPKTSPWVCDQTKVASQSLPCTLTPAPGKPTIPVGGSVSMDVALSISQADLSSAPCDVPNTATLSMPAGLTTAPVTDPLPTGSGCIATPPSMPPTKAESPPDANGIKVGKEADAGDCVPNAAGTSLTCGFTITVTNTGTNPAPATVAIVDTSTFGNNSSFNFDPVGSTPGWLCPSVGTAEADCSLPGASLGPSTSATLRLTMTVPTPAGVDFSKSSCSVPNSVMVDGEPATKIDIATNLPAGTGNCQAAAGPTPPPLPVFSVTKTGDNDCVSGGTTPGTNTFDTCNYTVVVTFNQPYVDGVITIDDSTQVAGATLAPDPSDPTWQGCNTGSNVMSCPLGQATYAAGQKLTLPVVMTVPFTSIVPGVTSCSVKNDVTVTATNKDGTIGPIPASGWDTLPDEPECVPAQPPFSISKAGDQICTPVMDTATGKPAYDCTYTAKITSTGPFSGQLILTDVPLGGAATWQNCPGATGTSGSGVTCTMTGPSVGASQNLIVTQRILKADLSTDPAKPSSCTVNNFLIAGVASSGGGSYGAVVAPIASDTLPPDSACALEQFAAVKIGGQTCTLSTDGSTYLCPYTISAVAQAAGTAEVTILDPVPLPGANFLPDPTWMGCDANAAFGPLGNGLRCQVLSASYNTGDALNMSVVLQVPKTSITSATPCAIVNRALVTTDDSGIVPSKDAIDTLPSDSGCRQFGPSTVMSGKMPVGGDKLPLVLGPSCKSLGAGWQEVADATRLPKNWAKQTLTEGGIAIACARLAAAPVGDNTKTTVDRRNFTILKSPLGCTGRAAMACSYQVTITNAGPASYSGKVDFTDVVENKTPGTTVDKPGAPWACDNGLWHFHCWQDNVTLGKGDSVSATITVKPGPKFRADMACQMPNAAYVSVPAGNTPENTNAGDDSSRATDISKVRECSLACEPGWKEVPSSAQLPVSLWTKKTVTGFGVTITCARLKPKTTGPAKPKPSDNAKPKTDQNNGPLIDLRKLFCDKGQLRRADGSCPTPPPPPNLGNGKAQIPAGRLFKTCSDGSVVALSAACPVKPGTIFRRIPRSGLGVPDNSGPVVR